jgi:hypothetical protein
MNPSSITNRGSKEKTVTKRGEVYPLKDGDIISLLCTKHEEKGKFRLQFPDPEDNSQPVTTDFEQTLAVSDLDILIDCIGDSPSQSRKNSSNLSTYMQREIRESLEPNNNNNNNTNVIKEVEPDNSVDKTIENDSQKNKHEKNSEERDEKEMSVHEDEKINDETSQNNNTNNNKTYDSIKEDNNSINDNKTELMQVEEVKLTGRKRKASSKRQHRKKINDETEDNNNTNNDDNKSEDDESDVNEYSDGDGSPDTRHRRKRQRIDRLAENLMNLNEKTEDELEAKNFNNKNEQVDSNDKNERDFSKEVKTILIAI